MASGQAMQRQTVINVCRTRQKDSFRQTKPTNQQVVHCYSEVFHEISMWVDDICESYRLRRCSAEMRVNLIRVTLLLVQIAVTDIPSL